MKAIKFKNLKKIFEEFSDDDTYLAEAGFKKILEKYGDEMYIENGKLCITSLNPRFIEYSDESSEKLS